MGNPNENIEHAIRYFDMTAEEEARSHRVGGILAALLLGGVIFAVVLAIVVLILAVN